LVNRGIDSLKGALLSKKYPSQDPSIPGGIIARDEGRVKVKDSSPDSVGVRSQVKCDEQPFAAAQAPEKPSGLF
jgi:hypothetical protein